MSINDDELKQIGCILPINCQRGYPNNPTISSIATKLEFNDNIQNDLKTKLVQVLGENEPCNYVEKGLVYDKLKETFEMDERHNKKIFLAQKSREIVITVPSTNFNISSKTFSEVSMIKKGPKPGAKSLILLQVILQILSPGDICYCTIPKRTDDGKKKDKKKKKKKKRKRGEEDVGEEAEEAEEGAEEEGGEEGGDVDHYALGLVEESPELKTFKKACTGPLTSQTFDYTEPSTERVERNHPRYTVDIELCYSDDPEDTDTKYKRQTMPVAYQFIIRIYDPRIDLNRGIRTFILGSKARSCHPRVIKEKKDKTRPQPGEPGYLTCYLANNYILTDVLSPVSYLEMVERCMGRDDFLRSECGYDLGAADAFNMISSPKSQGCLYVDIHKVLSYKSLYENLDYYPYEYCRVNTDNNDRRSYMIRNGLGYPEDSYRPNEDEIKVINDHFIRSCMSKKVYRCKYRGAMDVDPLDIGDDESDEKFDLTFYKYPFRVFRLTKKACHPKVVMNSVLLHLHPIFFERYVVFQPAGNFETVSLNVKDNIEARMDTAISEAVLPSNRLDRNKSDIEINRFFIMPELSPILCLVESEHLYKLGNKRSIKELRLQAVYAFYGMANNPGEGLPPQVRAIYDHFNHEKNKVEYTMFPDFNQDELFSGLKHYKDSTPLSSFISYVFTELYENGAPKVGFLHKEVFHTLLNCMSIYRGELYDLQPLSFYVGRPSVGKSYIKKITTTYLIRNSNKVENSATSHAWENGGLENDMAIIFVDDAKPNSGYFKGEKNPGVLETRNVIHSDGIIQRARTINDEKSGTYTHTSVPTYNRFAMVIGSNYYNVEDPIRARGLYSKITATYRSAGINARNAAPSEKTDSETVLHVFYTKFQTFCTLIGNAIRSLALPYAKSNEEVLNVVFDRVAHLFNKYYNHSFGSDQRLKRKISITAYSLMLLRIWVSCCLGLVEGIVPGESFDEQGFMDVMPKVLVMTEEDVLQSFALNESEFDFVTELDIARLIQERLEYKPLKFTKKPATVDSRVNMWRANIDADCGNGNDKMAIHFKTSTQPWNNQGAWNQGGASKEKYDFDYINLTKALGLNLKPTQEALIAELARPFMRTNKITDSNIGAFSDLCKSLFEEEASHHKATFVREFGNSSHVLLNKTKGTSKREPIFKIVAEASSGYGDKENFKLLYMRERLDKILKKETLLPLKGHTDVEGFRLSRLNIVLQHASYNKSQPRTLAMAGFPLRDCDDTSWVGSRFENLDVPQAIPFILQPLELGVHKEDDQKIEDDMANDSFKKYLDDREKRRVEDDLDDEEMGHFDLDGWAMDKVLRNLAKYDYEADDIEQWVNENYERYAPYVIQEVYKGNNINENASTYINSTINSYMSTI